MIRFRLLLIAGLICSRIAASTVDVRLLSDLKSVSVIVSITSGKYALKADGRLICDTLSAAIFEFNLKGDSVTAKTLEKPLGTFKNISLSGLGSSNTFKLKSISPGLGTRTYDDDLIIRSLSAQQLLLINHVDLEKYVPGVVEAESGTIADDEFYKVQSILCRTYALANLAKHSPEGFSLCDQVHCQVFRGKTKDDHIYKATHATKDLVVVDNDLKLIPVTFCSNCGGQTANPEDVWGKAVPCLKSIRDTFCIHMPHARWERKISVEDWRNYLELKHRFPVKDSAQFSNALNCAPTARAVYFTDKDLKIPLKVIRNDFLLKSTFFSVEQHNDTVFFKGKGYGHGVGLCQEGAMHMAKLGMSYKDILNFYYRNITIVDLDKMEFFKEEGD